VADRVNQQVKGGVDMTKRFGISQVRLPPNGGYLVVAKLKEGSVEATFEVALPALRQRRGRHRELKHHTELETLEAEAQKRVAAFCRSLAETLGQATPQQ
jgi:hypothetical protein